LFDLKQYVNWQFCLITPNLNTVSSQVMFALQVHSNRTHFNQQSLKETAQVGRKMAKAVT